METIMTEQKQVRTFDMSLEIDAPVDAVWNALTDAAELCNWFPLEARVKPGEGGSIFISWGSVCEGEAPITLWKPNQRFQWTEQFTPNGRAAPVPVTIDFTLDAAGGKTVLRLVQSGFGRGESWDGYYDSISRGWNLVIRGLRHYLHHHLGQKREVIWVRRRITQSPDDVAKLIIGPKGRVLGGTIGGLTEGDAYRLDVLGGSALDHLEGELRVNGLPRFFGATVTNLNNAYLCYQTECIGEQMEMWLLLSTYGVERTVRERIEREWTAAIDKALA